VSGAQGSGAIFSRRSFVKGAAGGALALHFGAYGLLSPRQARARGVPVESLTPGELELLETYGETLAPGAAEAGLAHYIGSQLAAPPADSLLFLRLLDIAPPYADFYRPGLAALDALAQARHGRRFPALAEAQRLALAREIAGANPPGWTGPPAPLFAFALRADAIDVVWGTAEGFERLGVPYLPHIHPEAPW